MKFLIIFLFIEISTGIFGVTKANSTGSFFPSNFKLSSACDGDYPQNWNSCVGDIKLNNGTRYIGDFINGAANGFGYMIITNGTKVLGHFSNNQVNGLALLIKTNGDRYAGYFKDNLFHGNGVYKKNDGEIFSGNWEKDIFKQEIEILDDTLLTLIEYDIDEQTKKMLASLDKPSKNNIAADNLQNNLTNLPELTLYVPAYDQDFKTIKNIKNETVFENPEKISGNDIQVCLLIDQKELQNGGLYYVEDSLSVAIRDYFNELAPNYKPIKIGYKKSLLLDGSKSFNGATDCWDWDMGQIKLGVSDLILIRDKDKDLLADNKIIPGIMPDPYNLKFFSILSSQVMDGKLFSGYKPFFKINNSSLLAKKDIIEADKKKQQKDSSDRISEFESLAKTDSKEVIASISFDIEDYRLSYGELSLCTSGYEDEKKMIIDGYALLGLQPYSESYKNKITKKFSNSSIAKKIHNFKDINQFYINQQLPDDSRIRCNVYIDYPSIISEFLTAIQANKLTIKVELNAMYNTDELLDKYITTNTSFVSYKDYQFASKIGATSKDLEILKQNDISDVRKFNDLINEMHNSNYANSKTLTDVISYVKDKKEGGDIKGAIKLRDARKANQAKIMKESIARQQKLDKMRANKLFKQGIICVGQYSLAYGQMQVIIDLYGSSADIRSITTFILNSNGCFLKDIYRKGHQLKEVSRNGNFVMVQDSTYVSPYTGFGMIHSSEWDNP